MSYVDDLRRQGYGVMRDIIPREKVDELRDSISATVRLRTSKPMPQGYVGGLLRWNQQMANHLIHPEMMELCDAVLGRHSRISTIAGTVNEPGVPAGGLHADWPHSPRDEAYMGEGSPNGLAHLVTFWMLSDFTPENGATTIIPGSHLRRGATTDRSRSGDTAKGTIRQLVGSAGDVGLLDARTLHAIGANSSSEDRVAVIVRYAPWWLNLAPLRLGSRDRRMIVDAHSGKDPYVMPLPKAAFDTLPAAVQALAWAMVEDDGPPDVTEGPSTVR